MRTPYMIAGAALMAAFAIGCSKNSNQVPTVHFLGYKGEAGANGYRRATFDFINPSQSIYVFQARYEPDKINAATAIVQPMSTNSIIASVRDTNTMALSVKVMKVVSVQEVTVPMPDIAWQPASDH